MLCDTIKCSKDALILSVILLPEEFFTLVFCFTTQSTVNSVSLLYVKFATIDLYLLTAAVFNVGHTDVAIFHYGTILRRKLVQRQSCRCQYISVQGIN